MKNTHPCLDRVSLETLAILQATNVTSTASILVICQAYMLFFWSYVLNHGLHSQLKEITSSISKSGKRQGKSIDQTGVIFVGHFIKFKLVPDFYHRL